MQFRMANQLEKFVFDPPGNLPFCITIRYNYKTLKQFSLLMQLVSWFQGGLQRGHMNCSVVEKTHSHREKKKESLYQFFSWPISPTAHIHPTTQHLQVVLLSTSMVGAAGNSNEAVVQPLHYVWSSSSCSCGSRNLVLSLFKRYMFKNSLTYDIVIVKEKERPLETPGNTTNPILQNAMRKLWQNIKQITLKES